MKQRAIHNRQSNIGVATAETDDRRRIDEKIQLRLVIDALLRFSITFCETGRLPAVVSASLVA